jgi:hypothetical protein
MLPNADNNIRAVQSFDQRSNRFRVMLPIRIESNRAICTSLAGHLQARPKRRAQSHVFWMAYYNRALRASDLSRSIG